jgi:hypothetical protein
MASGKPGAVQSVSMELRDVASDVLLGLVPKYVHLGFVGAKNNPVAADDMQAYRAVIEEASRSCFFRRTSSSTSLRPVISWKQLMAP